MWSAGSSEYYVNPVVGCVERARRETGRGAVVIDTVTAARSASGSGQGPVGVRRGEIVAVRGIVARGVIRGNVGRTRRDRERRDAHRLPATRCFAGESRARETRAR